jgi:hypothetical protein
MHENCDHRTETRLASHKLSTCYAACIDISSLGWNARCLSYISTGINKCARRQKKEIVVHEKETEFKVESGRSRPAWCSCCIAAYCDHSRADAKREREPLGKPHSTVLSVICTLRVLHFQASVRRRHWLNAHWQAQTLRGRMITERRDCFNCHRIASFSSSSSHMSALYYIAAKATSRHVKK